MAIWIKAADQTLPVETVNPTNHPDKYCRDGSLTLDAMQQMVGGFIELVQLRKPIELNGVRYTMMIIDEEGKILGKPVNGVATVMSVETQSIHQMDCIVGDAVLLADGEIV